jgi:hypothetical protein
MDIIIYVCMDKEDVKIFALELSCLFLVCCLTNMPLHNAF